MSSSLDVYVPIEGKHSWRFDNVFAFDGKFHVFVDGITVGFAFGVAELHDIIGFDVKSFDNMKTVDAIPLLVECYEKLSVCEEGILQHLTAYDHVRYSVSNLLRHCIKSPHGIIKYEN